MKFTILNQACFAAFYGALLIFAHPLLNDNQASSNGYIHMPIVGRNTSKLSKRQDFTVPLANAISSYNVQVGVGTPPQQIILSLDTGSGDIWLYGPGSCSKCEGGIFDPSQSRTLIQQPTYGEFDITYFDETHDVGYYVTDTFEIGGMTLNSATLAVTTQTTDRSVGILGISLDASEAGNKNYNGFIEELVNYGLINSHAYSIYLDDLESNTGALILGGYDPSKYTGPLVSLPILSASDSGKINRLDVPWTSLSITGSSGEITNYSPSYLPYPAVLDTDYTLTVLDDSIFQQFVQYFGAYQNDQLTWKVNCDLGTGSVNFGFGQTTDDDKNSGIIISVPFSEFAIPNNMDNTGGCAFGFEPIVNENPVISFGDTFLRSAYVVYNYDTMTISLAQASFGSDCNDCVIPI